MKIYSVYDKPPFIKEKGGGVSEVETAGYIPAEVQIQDMLNAGRRLGEYRRERYDFGSDEEIPKDYYDPTRSPGFDMADASQLQQSVAARLRERAAQAAVLQEKPEQDVSGADGGKV